MLLNNTLFYPQYVHCTSVVDKADRCPLATLPLRPRPHLAHQPLCHWFDVIFGFVLYCSRTTYVQHYDMYESIIYAENANTRLYFEADTVVHWQLCHRTLSAETWTCTLKALYQWADARYMHLCTGHIWRSTNKGCITFSLSLQQRTLKQAQILRCKLTLHARSKLCHTCVQCTLYNVPVHCTMYLYSRQG